MSAIGITPSPYDGAPYDRSATGSENWKSAVTFFNSKLDEIFMCFACASKSYETGKN